MNSNMRWILRAIGDMLLFNICLSFPIYMLFSFVIDANNISSNMLVNMIYAVVGVTLSFALIGLIICIFIENDPDDDF